MKKPENHLNIIIGTSVQWKWKGRIITGEVLKIYLEPVRKQLKGSWIKRNASPEKPAFLVKSKAGNLALKSITEIEKL
jgi:hypothetical protein